MAEEDRDAAAQECEQVVQMVIEEKNMDVKRAAIKYVHRFLPDEELFMQFVYHPKFYKHLLELLVSDDENMVVEVIYLFVKTFELMNDDIASELTQINFISTLYETVTSSQWDQNMKDFSNSLDVQRLLFLAVANMSGHPIFYSQLVSHKKFSSYLLKELTGQKSERVLKCLIMAVSSLVYYSEEQSQEIDGMADALLLKYEDITDVDSQFSIMEGINAYTCIAHNNYSLNFDVIFKTLQNYGGGDESSAKIIHECLKVLNNYSLCSVQEFFLPRVSQKAIALYDLYEEGCAYQKAVLQILLNMSSIESACASIARNLEFREKLLVQMMKKDEEVNDLIVQILQNIYFYGQHGGFNEGLASYIMQTAITELNKNTNMRYCNKILNLVNQMLAADSKYIRLAGDFQFRSYQGNNSIVDQICQKMAAYDSSQTASS